MQRVCLLCFIAGLAVAAAFAQARRPMPDFRARTLKGETLTKESFRGKPFLIQFWTTWCGYCRGDQPAVEQFIQERKDIPVLCVSVREARATVTKYLSAAPRSCKVVVTEDTNLTDIINPTGFPKYILVDANGKIGSVQDGAGGIEALRETLGEAGLR